MTPRRKFIRNAALLGVGTHAFLRTGSLNAAVSESDARRVGAWPEMQYTVLGRTGFNASRLVFGCGAALSRKPGDRMLNAAFDRGVNVYDVGTSKYYGAAERHLSAFAREKRDEIFLISKAFLEAGRDEVPNLERSRYIAKKWLEEMDLSLRELRVDYVDAYYTMDAKNPAVVKNEEIYRAFETAKEAGKVRYFGLSSHDRAQEVLEAATETGWYDLAMIAVTPAGWYDWQTKATLADSPPLTELKPILAKAKEAGIGLVGMKAARMLAGRMFAGRGNKEAFNGFYNEKLNTSGMSAFQKSYAYVLEHGMDVVNADIQNFDILEENFVAASTAKRYA